jgi:hypothetical protein
MPLTVFLDSDSLIEKKASKKKKIKKERMRVRSRTAMMS